MSRRIDAHRRRNRGMPIANLYFNFEFRSGRERIIDQADAIGGQPGRVEILARRNYDLAGVSANLAHVESLASREPETAALPDGEAMHSRMLGEPVARAVDHGAGANLLRRGA